MLPVRWTSFVLSLWILGSTGAEKASAKTKARCDIVSPFKSKYVKVFQELYTPGRGCSTNETSSSPTRQVHIVDVKIDRLPPSTRRQQVQLKIEPGPGILPVSDMAEDLVSTADTEEEAPKLPMVIVLSSSLPVKWKVELVNLPNTQLDHLFVIPNHSIIRFKKSRRRERLHVKVRVQQYPRGLKALVGWVRKQYGVLTSYNQVSGTSLLFRAGMDMAAGSECDLGNLTTSHRIVTTSLVEQKVAGCVAEGRRHPVTRPAFIIELEQAPQGRAEVELDITSLTGLPLTKNFCLILKSPPNVKWHLTSRRVHGWIDIVTNTGIDMEGIRMHPVASRREVMEASGAALIEWVEYFINPIHAYTRITTGNRITLLLPPTSKTMRMRLPPGLEPIPGPVTGGSKLDLKDHLKQIIHTRCQHGLMTVAIPKYFMEELGLVQDQITLLDPSCGPRQNKSHVILKSKLDGCNTKQLIVDDSRVFSNAIVIHTTGTPDSVGEEYGSAFIDGLEGSGSGQGADTGTYQDDEDFTPKRAVNIDVQCQVPLSIDPYATSEETEEDLVSIDYRVQLYSDHYYLRQRTFPATVTAASRLYIQASVKDKKEYAVVVQNCWFSPSSANVGPAALGQLDRFNVIKDGCSILSTLREDNGYERAVRFSIPMASVQQALPGQASVSLHCQLAVCQRAQSDGHLDIPLCLSAQSSLECSDLTRLKTSLGSAVQVVTSGPLEITDKEVDISINSANGVKGSSGEGSSGHSRSGQTDSPQERVTIIEGLDSPTVISIAFGTFAIGMVFTGALWFIHTKIGPKKRAMASQASSDASGESTPGSMSPISSYLPPFCPRDRSCCSATRPESSLPSPRLALSL